ncbi:tetraacyldisaccharide 4'-kinase [Candidatus Ruminimicrobium bovinum]|uniref:tetraacyldisaccharide 4'-kinase n=1 Tax=Candidatus Ruminimicrobium bovinum TaxID=3242779 RepID=UPI0039B83F22
MKYLLYPLSILYCCLSKLNKFLTKSYRLNKPVISIGNITWGGSGKTPMVIETASYILSLCKTPVILSRGYARKNKSKQNVIVRDKKQILSDLENSGDEPLMTANLLNCPIVVGSNRIKNAEISEKFLPDIFVLDDGFQHWKIKRDIDIVCINSLNPFGNGMIIPAGILRENLSALKRANLIILTNCNLCDKEKLQNLKNKILKITGLYPLETSLKFKNITNLFDDREIEENLKNVTDFTIISAIGSPENFINTVKNSGLKVKNKFIFRDHHKYVKNDIVEIVNKLSENEKIITTAKDAVKIKEVIDDEIRKRIYVLNMSIIFDKGKDVFEREIKLLLGINYEK